MRLILLRLNEIFKNISFFFKELGFFFLVAIPLKNYKPTTLSYSLSVM